MENFDDLDDVVSRASSLERAAVQDIWAARLTRSAQTKRLAQARAGILLRIAHEGCERSEAGGNGTGPLLREIYGLWHMWKGDGADNAVISTTTEIVLVGPRTPARRERTIWAWAAPHLPEMISYIDVCTTCGEIYVRRRKDQKACRRHGQDLRNLRKQGVDGKGMQAQRLGWALRLSAAPTERQAKKTPAQYRPEPDRLHRGIEKLLDEDLPWPPTWGDKNGETDPESDP